MSTAIPTLNKSLGTIADSCRISSASAQYSSYFLSSSSPSSSPTSSFSPLAMTLLSDAAPSTRPVIFPGGVTTSDEDGELMRPTTNCPLPFERERLRSASLEWNRSPGTASPSRIHHYHTHPSLDFKTLKKKLQELTGSPSDVIRKSWYAGTTQRADKLRFMFPSSSFQTYAKNDLLDGYYPVDSAVDSEDAANQADLTFSDDNNETSKNVIATTTTNRPLSQFKLGTTQRHLSTGESLEKLDALKKQLNGKRSSESTGELQVTPTLKGLAFHLASKDQRLQNILIRHQQEFKDLQKKHESQWTELHQNLLQLNAKDNPLKQDLSKILEKQDSCSSSDDVFSPCIKDAPWTSAAATENAITAEPTTGQTKISCLGQDSSGPAVGKNKSNELNSYSSDDMRQQQDQKQINVQQRGNTEPQSVSVSHPDADRTNMQATPPMISLYEHMLHTMDEQQLLHHQKIINLKMLQNLGCPTTDYIARRKQLEMALSLTASPPLEGKQLTSVLHQFHAPLCNCWQYIDNLNSFSNLDSLWHLWQTRSCSTNHGLSGLCPLNPSKQGLSIRCLQDPAVSSINYANPWKASHLLETAINSLVKPTLHTPCLHFPTSFSSRYLPSQNFSSVVPIFCLSQYSPVPLQCHFPPHPFANLFATMDSNNTSQSLSNQGNIVQNHPILPYPLPAPQYNLINWNTGSLQ